MRLIRPLRYVGAMLLPTTRMKIKRNLKSTKLTTTRANTRAKVRRGRRPTKALPHQEVTSRGELFAPFARTSVSFNTQRAVYTGCQKKFPKWWDKPAGLPRRPAGRRPPFRKFLLAITLALRRAGALGCNEISLSSY